jgi:hypothetical protein
VIPFAVCSHFAAAWAAANLAIGTLYKPQQPAVCYVYMSCVDHNSIIIAELRAIFSGLNNRKEFSSKRIFDNFYINQDEKKLLGSIRLWGVE